MPRANAMVPPDAIRIEDEVWQEAFTRREPARPSRERKLHAIERDHPDWLLETTGKTLAEAASWSVPRRATRETAASTRAAVRYEPTSSSARPEPTSTSTVDVPEPAAAVPEPPVAVPPIAPPRHASNGSRPQTAAAPVRRTVKIQGRGAERNLPLPHQPRRRPPRRAYERSGFRPDRLAMWAVMLGFLLVLIAVISAHS